MDVKGMDEDTVTWMCAIEALPVVSLLSLLTKKSGFRVTLRCYKSCGEKRCGPVCISKTRTQIMDHHGEKCVDATQAADVVSPNTAEGGASALADSASNVMDLMMRLPPQSLHWLLTRWCSQMPAPPQSLHWCFLPLMLADAAAATLFTRAPHPLVLADAAAATLFTRVPHPLMLADAAAAALFTRAPHPLMLADAAAATLFTGAPAPPLVLAHTAAAAVFTVALLPLVLAEAAAAAVFALAFSTAGARRGCLRRSLCTGSSPAGARRCRCCRSPCICSSLAGARRFRCHRSLYTGSFAADVRTCGVFLGALRAHGPPISSSCPRPSPSPHLDRRWNAQPRMRSHGKCHGENWL